MDSVFVFLRDRGLISVAVRLEGYKLVSEGLLRNVLVYQYEHLAELQPYVLKISTEAMMSTEILITT